MVRRRPGRAGAVGRAWQLAPLMSQLVADSLLRSST
jgi:hypothetical protein